VRIMSPVDISGGMLGRTKYNLNAMSHDTAIALISAVIDHGVDVQEVN
jgi:ribonuclease H2 subunit A